MSENENRPEPEPPAAVTDLPTTTPEPVPAVEPEPVAEVAPELVAGTVPESAVEVVPEPVAESTPVPSGEAVPEPAPAAVPEPVTEAAPEPVAESTPVPSGEAVPEPVPAAVPELVTEAAPELVAGTAPEPVAEAAPVPTAEATPEPTAEPAPEAVMPPEGTEPLDSAEPSVRKPARRRRGVALVGALLLVAGVVGGVGYTVVTVDGADRDAGAPVWTFPKATPETAKPTPAKGLSGMLLPYSADGWQRGPDIGQYGYDAELSGARATALRKEALSGLPRTQRKALERQIDKQRLKGIAMRSYLSSFYAQEAATVTVELSELESASTVREISAYQDKLVDALDDVLRKGPEIVGHKDARCFLAPENEDEKLDEMVCFAHQGNVLVSLTAESAKPMVQSGIAKLLREQLDRIAEPGESV